MTNSGIKEMFSEIVEEVIQRIRVGALNKGSGRDSDDDEQIAESDNSVEEEKESDSESNSSDESDRPVKEARR
jgi:hypothetical protein